MSKKIHFSFSVNFYNLCMAIATFITSLPLLVSSLSSSLLFKHVS